MKIRKATLNDVDTIVQLINVHADVGQMLFRSREDVCAHIQDFLIAEYAVGRRCILIIDEAQNLSLEGLEELRMLTNVNANKDELLQLEHARKRLRPDLISGWTILAGVSFDRGDTWNSGRQRCGMQEGISGASEILHAEEHTELLGGCRHQ